MKVKPHITFITITLTVLAIPVITFNRKGTTAVRENRMLAAIPCLIRDGNLNGKLLPEYGTWLEDRFGGRELLLSLNAWVTYDILRARRFNERAIQGKRGWYFYIHKGDGDNLSDFYKQNLLTDGERADFKKRVRDTADWCTENGIKCLFLIGPNKHSVYEEFYPFERPAGPTRGDQLAAAFRELDVPLVFPRDYLISQKAAFGYPLYYETDTHWNPQGAYLAFTRLREALTALFPAVEFPQIAYEVTVGSSMTDGDILPMLGIRKAKSTRPSLRPVKHENSDFYTYLKNEGTQGVHTEGTDRSLPRAIVFRDSFFSALEPFTSPLFSETDYRWKRFQEEDKEAIIAYHPDIIIFETVERYSFNIARP